MIGVGFNCLESKEFSGLLFKFGGLLFKIDWKFVWIIFLFLLGVLLNEYILYLLLKIIYILTTKKLNKKKSVIYPK